MDFYQLKPKMKKVETLSNPPQDLLRIDNEEFLSIVATKEF